jgi:hypothetical protein
VKHRRRFASVAYPRWKDRQILLDRPYFPVYVSKCAGASQGGSMDVLTKILIVGGVIFFVWVIVQPRYVFTIVPVFHLLLMAFARAVG